MDSLGLLVLLVGMAGSSLPLYGNRGVDNYVPLLGKVPGLSQALVQRRIITLPIGQP